MLIGITVTSISLSSSFDKIGENILIDYGFMYDIFSIRFFFFLIFMFLLKRSIYKKWCMCFLFYQLFSG
jgi:hypothetical protein